MGSPLFLLFFYVVGYPPNWGKWPRYIDRYSGLCLSSFAMVNLLNKLRMSARVEFLVEPALSLPQQRDLFCRTFFHCFHCSLPYASADSVEGPQKFARHLGFSRVVAHQLSLSQHVSHHSKWKVSGSWCRYEGHSSSMPSILKLTDFIFLQRVNWLPVSAFKGYRSLLSVVFRAVLPEISLSS